jgi:hypothetical protein
MLRVNTCRHRGAFSCTASRSIRGALLVLDRGTACTWGKRDPSGHHKSGQELRNLRLPMINVFHVDKLCHALSNLHLSYIKVVLNCSIFHSLFLFPLRAPIVLRLVRVEDNRKFQLLLSWKMDSLKGPVFAPFPAQAQTRH